VEFLPHITTDLYVDNYFFGLFGLRNSFILSRQGAISWKNLFNAFLLKLLSMQKEFGKLLGYNTYL